MVASTILEKSIVKAMRGVDVKLSTDMLNKCVAIATNFNLDASHLAETWEAHALNHNFTNLTQQTFTSYRNALTKTMASKKASQAPTPMKRAAVVSRPALGKRSTPSSTPTTAPGSPNVKRPRNDDDVPKTASSSSSVVVTPVKKSTKDTPSRAPPSVPYEHRKNAGEVLLTYNPQNLPPLDKNDDSRRICTISQPFDTHIQSTYKHMTDVARHVHLDDHLQTMSKSMLTSWNIPLPQDHQTNQDNDQSVPTLSTYEHVGVPRQSQQTNIGRVCNEAHSGKINSTTLLLEGSRHGSNGARIELDVSQLAPSGGYSLFQGQIVAVTGHNHSGRKMVVESLMEGLDVHGEKGVEAKPDQETQDHNVFRMVKTCRREMKRMHHGTDEYCQNGSGIKLFSVAGPYTTNQDLDYQPFIDLLGMVEVEKPDVVVMMGPFVDMRQDLVESGENLIVEYADGTKRHVSYEQFFAAKVSNELEALYESMPNLKTQFVIVPSLDDAVAEPVFPQPPLEDQLANGGKVMKSFPETEDMPFGSLCLESVETAGDKDMPKMPSDRRIHLVSNPSTIQINEVTIGFTSTDTVFHLSTESVNQKLPPGTRMTRLVEHLVKQQNYYPIFPPPSAPGREVNLDVTKRSAYAMPVQPDILILPSRLMPSAMDVAGGTTVVNPGYLVKGSLGGSFAVMEIHPMKENKLDGDGDEGIGHDIKDRIRVEVRRI